MRYFPGNEVAQSMVCDSIWSTPPGYEELAGEFEEIRNGGIFLINNSSNFWTKLSIDLFRNGGPVIYSFVCISNRQMDLLRPTVFFGQKLPSRYYKTKNATIAFFLFSSFPFPSLL